VSLLRSGTRDGFRTNKPSKGSLWSVEGGEARIGEGRTKVRTMDGMVAMMALVTLMALMAVMAMNAMY
jgi:hypothetical protein